MTLSQTCASLRSALRVSREVHRGRLPTRYDLTNWGREFEERARESLIPGACVLDAGSGRRPAIPVELRPANCRYVGLDLSRSELEQAPEGSYDEMIAGDIIRRIPELQGRFDLIVSFQVLEHVKPLDDAIDNLRSYLRPGGRLVTQLSGSLSVFGLLNRLLPSRTTVWMLKNLLGRAPETVFPAYYHRCWAGALERILIPWTEAEVIPVWYGAPYFSFSKTLQASYIGYEEFVRTANHRNLASHYVVDAHR